MKRELLTPRADWIAQCEAIGFFYHSIDGTYWDESRCYRFSADEIDVLEAATSELAARCLEAAEHIVAHGRMDELAIPRAWQAYVAASWQAREPSLFGRFDFAYDGSGPPKLLEFNADTPTALLEASVAQWHWLQQAILPKDPTADQFNSIHEKLIANWRALAITWSHDTPVHFTCISGSDEDRGNIDYLRDVATQAGLTTKFIAIEDIGWDEARGRFVDADEQDIAVLSKLYPWEWLIADAFGPKLIEARTRVIEPGWKMLLSNKGLLPILWELFPDHPNLMPSYFERRAISGDWVEKPLLSREGANVVIHRGNAVLAESGTYGAEGKVYQAYAPIPQFGDDFATIGSWVIGDEAAGIGIREDSTPITRNTSRFVPHYFA
jgi:glutathionylspermidine synthase